MADRQIRFVDVLIHLVDILIQTVAERLRLRFLTLQSKKTGNKSVIDLHFCSEGKVFQCVYIVNGAVEVMFDCSLNNVVLYNRKQGIFHSMLNIKAKTEG